MILVILLLLILLVTYKYIIRPYIQYKQYVKYGAGQFIPVCGELYYQFNDYEKKKDIEYTYKHLQDNHDGNLKIFVENLAGRVKVKLCHPDLIKDFFQQMNECYVDDMFFVQNFERLMGKGLVFSTGEQWKRVRQTLSPAFHFNYVNNLSGQIEKLTDDVFQKYVDNNKLDKVNTIEMMSEITSQVIIFSFFGSTLSDITFRGSTLTQAITFILTKIAYETSHTSYLLFGSRFLELWIFQEYRDTESFLQDFKKYLRQIIFQHIEKLTKEFEETGDIKTNCVLSILIKEGNIKKLSEKELLDNFWTLFIAGTDTTSHLVGMTIYYLTQFNDVYKELQKEIDQNTNTTSKGLLELPFLNAVLKETLRYYGPANSIFDRLAIKDHKLGDIKIEKGTVVNYLGHTVHRNPQLFKEPHSYRPDRWINGETNNLPSFAFIPFSGGARNCIGQHLALIEARIMLSKFIKKFDISLQENYQLKMFYGLVPQPEKPLEINLKLRN